MTYANLPHTPYTGKPKDLNAIISEELRDNLFRFGTEQHKMYSTFADIGPTIHITYDYENTSRTDSVLFGEIRTDGSRCARNEIHLLGIFTYGGCQEYIRGAHIHAIDIVRLPQSKTRLSEPFRLYERE